MGLTIPLLIYYLSILIIGIISFKKTLKMWQLKEIKYKELILGFLITLALTIITISYKEMNYWSLFFKISIIMFFIPYLIYNVTQLIKMGNYISKLIVINISYSIIGFSLYTLIVLF